MESSIEVFFSYAHEDEQWRDELEKHLSLLKRQHLITAWNDRKILPGLNWEQEIDSHLRSAQIILFLISSNFLASEYCWGVELREAMRRHQRGEALVIPIIVRPVDWHNAPFGKLQALPRDNRAITSWPNTDEALVQVTEGIRKAVTKWQTQHPAILSSSATSGYFPYFTKPQVVTFTVQQGDITSFDADVVALKYAQDFFGADKEIASRLDRVGVPDDRLRPPIGDFRFVETRDSIKAHHVLFVGVEELVYFSYPQIRQFSTQVLNILAKVAPNTRRLAMTIHGVGFGLDEIEAVHAQLAGYLDAIRSGLLPPYLESITIVESGSPRVNRLRQALEMSLNLATYAERIPGQWAYRLVASLPNVTFSDLLSTPGTIEEAGIGSEEKAHAFVAMPFLKEMDDVFYYGIQQPIRLVGLLCERVDQEAFTGDILDRVKKKIETAAVVIAELSGANPNVYLEVGYAWGKERPTILLVKSDQELRFDVRGQKCLKYERIKDLEESLGKELKKLQDARIIKSF